jgi:hypothetical protein
MAGPRSNADVVGDAQSTWRASPDRSGGEVSEFERTRRLMLAAVRTNVVISDRLRVGLYAPAREQACGSAVGLDAP